MSSSGYLVPQSEDPAQEKLWSETWKRIDRFLPDLRKELALDPPPKEAEIPAAAPVEEKQGGENAPATVSPVS